MFLFNEVFKEKEVKCDGRISINDDEFDAIICSMTGLLASMNEDDLRDYLKDQLREKDSDKGIDDSELIPEGYRLIDKDSLKNIKSINIKKCNWSIDLLKKNASDLWEGIGVSSNQSLPKPN